MDLGRLEGIVGHRFARQELLREALTHRSRGSPHNERLEFLGDSVLSCAVTEVLYTRFPRLDEGALSRLRAQLVRQESLARIAQAIGLGDYLRLGEGELKSGGFSRPSILADALEAVIGAVHVDAGFGAARAVVLGLFGGTLDRIDPRSVGKDPKTWLQELLQARRMGLPSYAVIATAGEAHQQSFEVECRIADLDLRTVGSGATRRAAEQEAARCALERINGDG